MLDYKTIIIKRYALKMFGREIARQIGASKSGINEFLKAFEECDNISYPLPAPERHYQLWNSGVSVRKSTRKQWPEDPVCAAGGKVGETKK